jgi:hypothetical protein
MQWPFARYESTTQNIWLTGIVFFYIKRRGSATLSRAILAPPGATETPRVLVASWEYICPPRSRPNFTRNSLAQHVPSKDLPDRWTKSATGRRHLAGFGNAFPDDRRGRPYQLEDTVSEVLIEMIVTGGTDTFCAAASII